MRRFFPVLVRRKGEEEGGGGLFSATRRVYEEVVLVGVVGMGVGGRIGEVEVGGVFAFWVVLLGTMIIHYLLPIIYSLISNTPTIPKISYVLF